jgi:hypothetical protein
MVSASVGAKHSGRESIGKNEKFITRMLCPEKFITRMLCRPEIFITRMLCPNIYQDL